MICIHWVNHHYFFRHIKKATVGMVWINNLLLLWICFLPFPTAMFGDHPTDQFPILLYSITSLVISLTFFFITELFTASQSFKGEGILQRYGTETKYPCYFTLCNSYTTWELSNDDVQQFAESDRREVDPPIPSGFWLLV
jgi:uncharacterized membrane protein